MGGIVIRHIDNIIIFDMYHYRSKFITSIGIKRIHNHVLTDN